MNKVACMVFVLLATFAAFAAPGAASPGSVDPSFRVALAPAEIPVDLCLAPDGTVYVLLDHPPGSSQTNSLVLRFFADGRRDESFRTEPKRGTDLRTYSYRSLKAGPDGRIYLEGLRNRSDPNGEHQRPKDGLEGPLSLLRPDGSIDETYGLKDTFDRLLHSYHPTSQGRLWAVGRLVGREGPSLVLLGADGQIQADAGSLHAPAGVWFNINSVIERSGNRLLLVGQIDWKKISPTLGLIQFGPDGRVDPTFHPPAEGFDRGPLANLWQATLDHADGILIAGLFRRAGDHPTTNLARLRPHGAVDTEFRAGPMDGAVKGVWEDEAGRLVIAGDFTRIQQIPRPGLARLLPTGALDTTYAPELPQGTRIAKAIDGGAARVLVAGYRQVEYQRTPVLVRLLPGDPLPLVPEILEQPKGVRRKVGADHAFTPLVRLPPDARLQWHHNGEPLPGATNAYLPFARLRMEDNGTYQLHLTAKSGITTSRPVPIVVEPAAATPGAPDMSADFQGGPSFVVHALRFLPDGRLLVGGEFQRFGTNQTGALAVLGIDGQLDVEATRRIAISGSVTALLPESDGMLVAGVFRQIGDHPTRCLARLNADGTIDRRLQSKIGPPSHVRSAARLQDGSYLVTGSLFQGPDPKFDFVPLARLQANGELDFTFAEKLGLSDTTFHASNLGDGRVVLAGWSLRTVANGFLKFLERDGSPVSAQANLNLKPSGIMTEIWTVPIGPDGLLIAGPFTLHNSDGDTWNGIAEFRNLIPESPKALGASLASPAGVACGTFDSSGRLSVAGLRIARWSAGKPDSEFRATVNGSITCIAADARGDVYVGGLFNKIGDVVRHNLAKLYGSDRTEPYILGPFRTEKGLVIQLETNEGWTYEVESTADISGGTWEVATTFLGDGKVQSLETDADASPHQFYRIRVRVRP
ncbi:MAG: delta-60 repeat domain-containing protein [Verrucomicrobiales bacterium]|nr:delta-60 repeat domain-containing protein [Verrucomicrobiales bacterium]